MNHNFKSNILSDDANESLRYELLTKCPVACHFLELVRTKTGLHRRDSFNRATLLSRIWT